MAYTPDNAEMLKAYQAYRAKQDTFTWSGWVDGAHPKRYTAEFNRWLKTAQPELNEGKQQN